MQPIIPARIRFEGSTPVSEHFDDSYFMHGQGLAESQAVFIEANDLAERFAALRSNDVFVIGETGFGSGLNLLLAARCFEQHAPQGARLQLVSAELHPLLPTDLARALGHWPELAPWAKPLQAGYPPPVPGYHRIPLSPGIDLTLMLGDAIELWQGWQGQVDAWFLDGFAPARNPGMWNDALYQAIGQRSRPGASLATFTAAGDVRRGLASAGFEVERVGGFAGKRHRIIARWPGRWNPAKVRSGRAIVAGAGLAGATTARALAERGWQVRLLAPCGLADAASGNLAGVLYSTPSAHLTAQNRFYQLALLHALMRLRQIGFPARTEQGRLNDVILQAEPGKAADKLGRALDSGAWPEAMLARLDTDRYRLIGAGYLSPPAWIADLLDHPSIRIEAAALSAFESGQGVRVRTLDERDLEAELLVLCMAEASAGLPGLGWLPLKRIRGQVSYCRATAASRRFDQAICHAGYFTPEVNGLHCVGATFDLHDPNPVLKEEDDQANFEQLKTGLPEVWAALGGEQIEIVDRRVALRCQSRDFLPLAGPLPDPSANPHRIQPGVWLNLAHGSRGLTHTPLCAELIADQVSGLPLPADPEITAALAPERFILRARRRDPDWYPDSH
jgi:tRNA 5-methylaminomethyl-2-thiouridine biosynthesis bifunctional protein